MLSENSTKNPEQKPEQTGKHGKQGAIAEAYTGKPPVKCLCLRQIEKATRMQCYEWPIIS
jgi:hypothetical protein